MEVETTAPQGGMAHRQQTDDGQAVDGSGEDGRCAVVEVVVDPILPAGHAIAAQRLLVEQISLRRGARSVVQLHVHRVDAVGQVADFQLEKAATQWPSLHAAIILVKPANVLHLGGRVFHGHLHEHIALRGRQSATLQHHMDGVQAIFKVVDIQQKMTIAQRINLLVLKVLVKPAMVSQMAHVNSVGRKLGGLHKQVAFSGGQLCAFQHDMDGVHTLF